MDLHKPGRVPDWEEVEPTARNRWQRLAAHTNGVVTIGNAISVAGVLLVLFGLVTIVRGHVFAGLWLMILGRTADAVDGLAANATKTKSTLGESVDASCDKLAAACVLIVLLIKGFLPAVPATLFIAQNAANGALTFVAKMRHVHMHPNRSGKLAAVAEWLAIPAFILSKLYGGVFTAVAYVFLLAFVGLGYVATTKYARFIQRKTTPSLRQPSAHNVR